MKKEELKNLIINEIRNANSVNDFLGKVGLSQNGTLNKIVKQIIKEENFDISHFKIVKKSRYQTIVKQCPVCKKDIITKKGYKKEQFYCSRGCSTKDRLVSEETKEKIRVAAINNDKLVKLLNNYTEDAINIAVSLREEYKTYEEVRNRIPNINKEDLTLVYKILSLNGNYKANAYNKDLIIEKYKELKSLRKTASYFNLGYSVIRRIVPILLKNIKYFDNPNKNRSELRRQTKHELVKYKGGKCEKCGYNKCEGAMHFHHLNPNEKDYNIAGKCYSLDKLKKEVDKCILLCANCHSETHEEIYNKNPPPPLLASASVNENQLVLLKRRFQNEAKY